ncbi:MAG: hypothetical protein M1136_06645 [Chloroflexi bacterium]|nr:hypothetical protein [Chloroflexota bacterium]MCL5075310.1 hypothetical protein [Chloroflexota bacterium]
MNQLIAIVPNVGQNLVKVTFIRSRLATMAIFFALLFAVVHPALAADGTIKGKISNKTSGGDVPSNQEVTLHIFVDFAEKDKRVIRSDPEGNFVFTGLSTGSEYVYVVSTPYRGVTYSSEPLTFGQNETEKSLQIAIYEPTDNDAVVSVPRLHIFLDVDAARRALLVSEVWQFQNSSDRSYIGSQALLTEGRKGTLTFYLPVGANNPTIEQGLLDGDLIRSERGFVETGALPPGISAVIFRYDLTYDGPQYLLHWLSKYAIENLNVFLADAGFYVRSDQLVSQPAIESAGKKFLHLSGQKIARNSEITINLSGLPQQVSTPTGTGEALTWGIPILLLGILSLAIVLFRLNRKGLPTGLAPAKKRGLSAEGELRKQGLLEEIAELDDQYEEGRIGKEQYLSLRAAKKQELLDVMAQLQREA